MSSRHKKGRSRSRNTNIPIIPAFYPPVPGYPVPGSQWMPPPPGANYSYQWFPSWPNIPHVNNQNIPWMSPHTRADKETSLQTTESALQPVGPDEYTVDSMRRVYNNDDGSIEIERVKVQRRQGIYDTKQNALETSTETQSLVPVSMADIQPPPRKNKKGGTKTSGKSKQEQGEAPPQGWYPFMPYLPQPFPYPYPYGYAWPMPPPSTILPPDCRSPTDESDSSISHQGGFPVSMESPDLVPENTRSPELVRPSSSAATSHVTESLGTDIAPSDSVSMRGFKRETSIERILRKSLSNPNQPDKRINSSNEDDMEKTKEWMEDMQKAFESKSANAPSDIAGDRSSFATATSDIPTPPTKHKIVDTVNKSKITHRKSNSESNIEDPDDQQNGNSLPLLDNTRVSDSDLLYSIKKQEQEKTNFGLEKDSALSSKVENKEKDGASVDKDGRVSRTSTMSFHSTRQSGDENPADTDSTDIAIPIDSSTADESIDNSDDENVDDDGDSNYKWILQSSGDSPEIEEAEELKPSGDLIENWRTEVSRWRARLVVSLCRGQGLDQQDWATFQLLVQHPLTLDLKLSLLHARRICSRNYDVGVALLRNALLHLTTFGESLMKPEAERPSGWKTVAIDSSQPWIPVKGSMEILRVFGYRSREDGILKYRRKSTPETSVVARLTLDLLVLAEEFRLFLTGSHQYPMNITHLFSSREFHSDKKNFESFEPSSQNKGRDSHTKTEFKVDAKDKDDEHCEKKPEAECNLLSETSIVSVEENISLDNPDQFSSISSNLRSSTTSIPELQSQLFESGTTLEGLEGQESLSRETLLASPVPDTSDSKSTENKTLEADESLSVVEKKGENNSHSKKTTRRCNGKDNPEDHIYEEINDIKAQIELLKEGESESRSPPPLPPKTKVSSQSQDIYPQVDWSISSQYSSIHSGSGARRKKRRAPMPPEFLSQDELDKNISDSKSLAEKQPSSEREVKPKQEVQQLPFNGNPFYEERIKPAGYVGKNPFYEDIPKSVDEEKTEGQQHEEPDTKASQIEKPPKSIDMSHKEDDDASEISESLPAGVRPQRRKNKNKSLKKNQKSLANEISQSNDMSPTVLESLESNTIKNKKSQEQNTKNEEEERQRVSQVAVPSEKSETERQGQGISKAGKKDVIFKKISITYDISLDDSTSSHTKTTAPPIPVKLRNLKEMLDKKLEVKLSPEAKGPSDNTCNITLSEQEKKSEADKSKEVAPSSLNNSETNASEVKEISIKDKHSLENSPVKREEVTSVKREVKNHSCHPVSSQSPELPPLPPPKPAFRLIDDIPYIDTSDVKKYKSNYSSSERKQSPHYGIGEIPLQSSDNDFTTNNKPSTTLDMLQDVPFIDDDDAFPDFSPPPPPPPPALSDLPSTLLTDYPHSQLHEQKITLAHISETSSKCTSQSSSELASQTPLPHLQQTPLPSSQSETPSQAVDLADSLSFPPILETQASDSTSSAVSSQLLEHKENSLTFSETLVPPELPQTPPSTCLSDTSPKQTETSLSLSETSIADLSLQAPTITSTPNASLLPPETLVHAPFPQTSTKTSVSDSKATPTEQTQNDTIINLIGISSASLSSPTPPLIPPPPTPPLTPPPPTPPLIYPPPTPPLTPPPPTPTLISTPPAPPLHPPPPTPSLYPSASQTPAISACESPILSVSEPLISDTHVSEDTNIGSRKLLRSEPIDTTGKTISSNKEEIQEEDVSQIGSQGEDVMLPSESKIIQTLDSGKSELDDSRPKSIIVFGSDKNLKPSSDTPPPEGDSHKTPISSRPASDFEERYEIPDVARAEAFDKAHPEARVSSRNLAPKTSAKSKENATPKRPPRHLQAFRVPPPRPPKPANIESPPDLPPKIGGSLKSVKSSGSTSNELTTSLPSTLCRVKENNHYPGLTLKDPAIQNDESPSASTKSTSKKASSMSAITSNKKSSLTKAKTSPSAAAKSLSKTSYPSSKSVSMPSSPKVYKYPSKSTKKDDSKQRSWPFQICDCVYPKSSNEDVIHVIKNA